MFAGFLLLLIFLRRHKFWLHRQFSSAQFRNEEMMGDGFFSHYCDSFESTTQHREPAVATETSAVASSIFFMVLFPMLFGIHKSYV